MSIFLCFCIGKSAFAQEDKDAEKDGPIFQGRHGFCHAVPFLRAQVPWRAGGIFQREGDAPVSFHCSPGGDEFPVQRIIAQGIGGHIGEDIVLVASCSLLIKEGHGGCTGEHLAAFPVEQGEGAVVVSGEDVGVVHLHMEAAVHIAHARQGHAVGGRGQVPGGLENDLCLCGGKHVVPAQTPGFHGLGSGVFRRVLQAYVGKDALPGLLAAQKFPDGEGEFVASDLLRVPLLNGDEERGGPGIRVIACQIAMPRAVKGGVDGIAVKEIHGLIHSCVLQILHGDIDLGGVVVDVRGGHLHADAVVLAGQLHGLEELGRGGGDGVQQLIGGGDGGRHGGHRQAKDKAQTRRRGAPPPDRVPPGLWQDIRGRHIGRVHQLHFIQKLVSSHSVYPSFSRYARS